ncbi:MAG TPA: sodium:solute symporter [Gemmatimonadaceae bacterium]|nr:sodium:solute symporter [Gemmatimonadaceae bacterium]
MRTNFTALDFIVLIVYLIGTTLLGVWLGRDQKDAKDYFVAGKTIPWWAILFSVVATETSALTFISIPGLAYMTNLGFLQLAAGYLLGRIVVAYTLLPKYYQGDLVTAYALLEKRFGVATRRFASIVFMGTRALADSVRIFATAIPIALIIGPIVPERYLMPAAILILGLLTLIYTYHGGMRAVIWTDVVQTVVYIGGGLAAVYVIGQLVTGGWSSIFTGASEGGKLKVLDLYLGFDRPLTLFAGLLGGAFLSMASHGADQLIVQRLLASSNLRDAQKALIGSGFAVILQFTLFLMIGLGLWMFYEQRTFAVPDSIFPTFVVDQMPAGLRGLIIAAVLAAAMSSFSGSMNSLAAATTHDIYLPLSGRSAADVKTLRMGKIFTLFWGLLLLTAALLYRQQGTPVVVVALSIASFTYGGLLGGFFLGMLWRRAIQRDAILGMATAIVIMSVVVFARPLAPVFPSFQDSLTSLSRIAWPWYVLIGTSITMIVGILSSLTHPAPTGEDRWK